MDERSSVHARRTPRRRKTGQAATLLFCVLAASTSCNVATDSDQAARAVDEFHAAFNAEQYLDMYNAASDEFRSSTKEADWGALLAAVRRKLGRFESGSETGVSVTTSTSGTAVNQQYSTRFADGTATERFTWVIRNGATALVGYGIDSPLLITR